MKVRLIVAGGFLGAGKTTALVRLARQFHDRGRRVGLITNDQAANLVDTGTLRVRGFRVEEVAGACFCCKFDDLARSAERLRTEERPDVLLAEPVGSCTDLAATVIVPFRKLFGGHYEVAPYSVLVDPVRARQMVLERGFGGFSPKVAYIFLKQLEEADAICLNKCDVLSSAERESLVTALEREIPHAKVLPISGLTGEGFEAWHERLASGAPAGRHVAEVDYDTYAEGEAELGWLNMAFDLSARRPFDGNALVQEAVTEVTRAIAARGSEIAHLKMLLEAEGGAAMANCVGAGAAVRLSQELGRAATSARLIVNARAHLDPEILRTVTASTLASRFRARDVEAHLADSAHFRPGRPVPTHRFAPDEAR